MGSKARRSATVIYTTRNLPASLRDRIRIVATLRRETMETVVNEALTIGMKAIEQDVFKAHGHVRMAQS